MTKLVTQTEHGALIDFEAQNFDDWRAIKQMFQEFPRNSIILYPPNGWSITIFLARH